VDRIIKNDLNCISLVWLFARNIFPDFANEPSNNRNY